MLYTILNRNTICRAGVSVHASGPTEIGRTSGAVMGLKLDGHGQHRKGYGSPAAIRASCNRRATYTGQAHLLSQAFMFGTRLLQH